MCYSPPSLFLICTFVFFKFWYTDHENYVVVVVVAFHSLSLLFVLGVQTHAAAVWRLAYICVHTAGAGVTEDNYLH